MYADKGANFTHTLIMLLVGVFALIGVSMVYQPLTDAATEKVTIADNSEAGTYTNWNPASVALSARALNAAAGVTAANGALKGVVLSGTAAASSCTFTSTSGSKSFTIAGTADNCQGITISYIKERTSAGLAGQFLTMFPFLMIVGGVLAMFTAAFRESHQYMQGNPTSILMRAITVIIGAVMLPLLIDQMNTATTVYSATSFVAIGTFAGLLPLAFILTLLNVAIPQLGARVISGVRGGYRGTGI